MEWNNLKQQRQLAKGAIIVLFLAALSISFFSTLNIANAVDPPYIWFDPEAYIEFPDNSTMSFFTLQNVSSFWTNNNWTYLGNDGFNIQSANITVTSYFQSKWLNYTVDALGIQQIIHHLKPYAIYLDGIQRDENDGWNYTLSGILNVIDAHTDAAISYNARPIDVSLYPITLYFRSDTYTTLGSSGYGLDTDFTNTASSFSSTYSNNLTSIDYGFRVWLISTSTSTELTSGTPTGIIGSFAGASAIGSYGGSWTATDTNVILGYQALKVMIYERSDNGSWTARATSISPILITDKIEASTWTFILDVDFIVTDSSVVSSVNWGNSAHKSGISGVLFSVPLESKIQMWRFNRGDYVGLVIGAYVDVIGEAFYVLLLLIFAGSLYFRYGHFGVVAVFFTLFGGVGGLVWLLVPPWAAAVVSAIIIIGTSFVVWRVIR